jgi:hypothetical protein
MQPFKKLYIAYHTVECVVFEGDNGHVATPLNLRGEELQERQKKKEVKGMSLIPVLWHKISVKDTSTE